MTEIESKRIMSLQNAESTLKWYRAEIVDSAYLFIVHDNRDIKNKRNISFSVRGYNLFFVDAKVNEIPLGTFSDFGLVRSKIVSVLKGEKFI